MISQRALAANDALANSVTSIAPIRDDVRFQRPHNQIWRHGDWSTDVTFLIAKHRSSINESSVRNFFTPS